MHRSDRDSVFDWENVCFSHAMLAVGYSDRSQSFIVRNSWGEDWVTDYPKNVG